MDLQTLFGWLPSPEIVGTWVAAVLTLVVFSYLLGDNFLFRLAENLFVGVALGYAAVVVFHSVLVPKLFTPALGALTTRNWGQLLLHLVPMILGLLLLTKSFKIARSVAWAGSFSVALLLGVGAALAIGGALLGTLVPQVDATADLTRYRAKYGLGLGLFSGIAMIVGVTSVLLHFRLGTGHEGQSSEPASLGVNLSSRLVRGWASLGRWFILVSFGAILATTFMSRLSLLIGRVQFLLDWVQELVGGWG